MRQLEVKIPGLFFDKTLHVSVPESYREMTSDQFHALCRLQRSELKPDEFLRIFFGFPERVWRALDTYYIYILTDLVRKIRANSFGSSFFDETVVLGNRVRFLPHMPSMSLMQYMTVDTYAQWYEYTKQDDYLAHFASVLVLNEDCNFFDYDPSESQSFYLGLIRTDSTMKLTLRDLLFNWQLIKATLAQKYPNMFPSAETSEDNPAEPKRPSDWTAVFDALVGEQLENIEAYKRLPAFDVFRIIDGRIRDNNRKR